MAGQSIGPAIQVLAASQAELANAMKRNEKKTMTLIDNRGVGKIPIKWENSLPEVEWKKVEQTTGEVRRKDFLQTSGCAQGR